MTPRVQAMVAQLKDESAEVRGEAALALGRLGAQARPAVPALMDRIADDVWGDPNTSIHRDNSAGNTSKDNALQALLQLAPEKVEEALLRATKSENPRVRRWASARLADDTPARKRR
jgi:HEAT repeat protein